MSNRYWAKAEPVHGATAAWTEPVAKSALSAAIASALMPLFALHGAVLIEGRLIVRLGGNRLGMPVQLQPFGENLGFVEASS